MANGQTVSKGSTATTLVSSQVPAIFGQAVTYTATVSSVAPASGIPDGTMTFFVDGVSQFTVPVDSSGQATFTTISLTVGTHAIRADYSGSALYNASTATFSQPVNRDNTITTVSSSAQPSRPGQPVIFTATITSVTGIIVPDSGTVTFLVDNKAVGSAVVVAGEASLVVSGLKLGSHSVVAQFAGNPSFFGSSSATLTQTVLKAGTLRSKTVVTSSGSPTAYGQPVTFTVTVSSALGAPEGAVTISINGVRQPPKNLVSGVATFTLTDLTVRWHRITARYYGDDAFRASSSARILHRVTKASTGTDVLATVNPSVVGEPVTFTATVSALLPGGGTPSGSVEFLVDNVQRGTVPLNASGQATLTLSDLRLGTHLVVVKYLGSTKYIASSTGANHTVQPAGSTVSTTTVVSSLNPSAAGQPVTFTANVSSASGTPTGSITFVVDSIQMSPVALVGGSASLTLSSLAAGTHSVRAVYYGDAIHASSASSTLTQTLSGSGSGGSGAVATGLAASLSNNGGLYTITVAALDAQNQQVADFSGPVSIAVANGPGSLQGGVSTNFVNGSARFQIRVTVAGTYTLRITSGNLQTRLSFTTSGRQL